MFLIDDYTRMTRVAFLKHKSNGFEKFKAFKALVENETDMKIKCLRLDNGGEFTSNEFDDFYETNGLRRHFLVARTPQQNGVVQMKNKSVQETTRTMFNEDKLLEIFSREVLYTTVHILHRGQLRVINSEKTMYELWKGRLATIKHFKVFGSKCYIKRDDFDLGKFDCITNEGIFLGYSSKIKSYRCYNMRLNKIVESANVRVDDTKI